jgi:SAM-dependent methyltransferase
MAPPDQDYFFSLKSVSAQQFHALLDSIRRDGWESAYSNYLKGYFAKKSARTGTRRKLRDLMLALRGRLVPGVVRAILCRSQAYHWLLTGMHENSTVLDLGAGWSAMSHVLAEECKEVVAADVTLERLQFSSLRAASGDVSNMSFVRTPSELPLPFADGTFDLVVINGVLEWVGASTAGRPEDVQRGYLQEVARILKPQGQVIIGIENRYGFSDLMGFPEGHVGLPFVGVLPRRIGDVMSRAARRGPLRVATHSGVGLKRLLADAGFAPQHMAVYAPQPTYSWYDTIGGHDETACAVVSKGTLGDHPMLRKRVGWLPASIKGASSSVVGAFYAVAGKAPWRSALQDLRDAISDSGLRLELPLENVRVREHKVTARIQLEGSERAAHLSIGMSPLGNRRVQREHDCLRALEQLGTGADVRVPQPLLDLTFRGHTVSILAEVSGRPLPESDTACDAWQLSARAVRFVESLRNVSVGTSLTVGQLRTERWNNLWPLLWTDDQLGRARDLEASLRPPAAVAARPAEFGHGDLLVGNILHDASTGQLAIIDWESSGPMYPAEDAVTVLLSHARARHGCVGAALVAMFDPSHRSQPPAWQAELALEVLPSEADYLRALVMAWLGHVAHGNDSYVQHDPEWLESRVWNVVDALGRGIEMPGAVGSVGR